MTIQENARFTVFRLTSEYLEDIDSIYLWDLVKMIKNAFNINAINEAELENLCYNLHVTKEEVFE